MHSGLYASWADHHTSTLLSWPRTTCNSSLIWIWYFPISVWSQPALINVFEGSMQVLIFSVYLFHQHTFPIFSDKSDFYAKSFVQSSYLLYLNNFKHWNRLYVLIKILSLCPYFTKRSNLVSTRRDTFLRQPVLFAYYRLPTLKKCLENGSACRFRHL